MLTLFHAPQSRSTRIIWLLEELGAEYAIEYVSIVRQDGSGGPDPANPHPDKKVPALAHDGALITESMAVALYLNDLFPQSEIARASGDRERGALLTWLFYYAGVIEPLVHFQFLGIEQDERLRRTFRGRSEMDARIRAALTRAPYVLGERFSAADVVITSLGQFMRNALPSDPAVDAYLKRCGERPALARAMAKDKP
ncbi:MAG TPA: glutathione S-transferase [Caulobacterales bacterium]|nr:glutathione S-transferase [Caulobacterales bacterium]